MHLAGRQDCRISPVKSEDLIEIYRRSGRPEDFEQIVRRFAALVLCECRRVTGNMYDAEDASQLVFLALAMEIKSGTNIQQLGAWLKRVSKRQALKIVRSRTRRKRREDAVRRTELHLVDIDTPLDQAIIAGVVRDAIDQLPERYRLAVVLHYFGGLTLEMIAVELKISKQAVGTRLHRGRKMLGKRLERQGVRLENGALASALAVLVPAAVVSAIVKSVTSISMPASVAHMPVTMTQMLRAAAVSATHRPLRLAAVAAALAAAGGTLAKVVGPELLSLKRINPTSALHWMQRNLGRGLPSFHAAPSSPLSASQGQPAVDPMIVWAPNLEGHLRQLDNLDSPFASNLTFTGSGAPVAYAPVQFGISHSESLGAPILETSVPASKAEPGGAEPPTLTIAAPAGHPADVPHDWTSPEPLRLAVHAGDSQERHLQPGVHTATTVDVGVAGDATITLASQTTLDANDIRIGVDRGSSGAIINTGGQVNTSRMIVGYGGAGSYRQRNNAQLNTGPLLIAVQPQSQGEVSIESGTVELTGPLQIGVQGSGRLNLGSADAPGVIHAASAAEVPIIVRATPEAHGVLKGWGTVATNGPFINNGQVIADGGGQNRTLDLSGVAQIENTIENPTNGTNGWYAQNGGSLLLPPIPVAAGTHTYTWGEDPSDPMLDLVNSVRFTVHNQPAPTTVSISLDSAVPNVPHAVIPGGVKAYSIFHVSGSGLEPDVSFAVRYSGALSAAAPTYLDSVVSIWAYDGGWKVPFYSSVDATNQVIEADFNTHFEYLIVGSGQAYTLPISSDSAATIPAVSVINPKVPEPTGLLLSVVTSALLIRRRRSN